MKYLKFKAPRNHGYSMVELLLVVSIIGVISALSYPVVRNFTSANAYAEARSKAEALTAAKVLFYRSDPYAKSKWDNAQGDDDARFELIRPFLDFESAETSLGEASLEEYAAAPPYDNFDLGVDVRNAVSLVDPFLSDGSGDGNNGHANNEDGVDVSNPGQGHGGPNGEDDPSGEIDDEAGNGNGNGNGN